MVVDVLSRSFHVIDAEFAGRKTLDGGGLGRCPNNIDL